MKVKTESIALMREVDRPTSTLAIGISNPTRKRTTASQESWREEALEYNSFSRILLFS